jgi:hypothetical protein
MPLTNNSGLICTVRQGSLNSQEVEEPGVYSIEILTLLRTAHSFRRSFHRASSVSAHEARQSDQAEQAE